jgi:hypothetical protein
VYVLDAPQAVGNVLKEIQMSRYEPLWKCLQTNGHETVKLTLEEIDAVLCFPLDHSFLTYKKEAARAGIGPVNSP